MEESIWKRINHTLFKLIFIFPIALITYFVISNLNGNNNLFDLSINLYKEIILGLILISVGYVLRYLRWRIIINNLGFYPNYKIENRLWLASYAFTATPGKFGEFTRCFFLKKVFNIPINHTFIAILIERFYDLIAVLLISLVLFIKKYNNAIALVNKNSYLLLFLILIIFFIYINLGRLKNYFLNKKMLLFGNEINLKSVFYLKNFRNLFRLEVISKLIILSLISWGLEGLSFFIILLKLGFSISYLSSTFVHTTSGLLGALTMLPGGLGSTEAITVSILKLNNIPIYESTSATSLIRLMTLWYITFLGLISLYKVKTQLFKNVKN